MFYKLYLSIVLMCFILPANAQRQEDSIVAEYGRMDKMLLKEYRQQPGPGI